MSKLESGDGAVSKNRVEQDSARRREAWLALAGNIEQLKQAVQVVRSGYEGLIHIWEEAEFGGLAEDEIAEEVERWQRGIKIADQIKDALHVLERVPPFMHEK